MIRCLAILALTFGLLVCAGCGPGRGAAVIRPRQIVLPDGTTAALHTMAVTGTTGDADIDGAIRQAQQADDAYWGAIQASNAWVTLHYEIRRGLTRAQYADRLQRQQVEQWYRTEITARDKAEAMERQLRLYDQISAQITAGTAADTQRDLAATAASRNAPAVAAYQALEGAVGPDDALLLTVAAYNQGMLIGITGRIDQAKALLTAAHDHAVRRATVDIIRQCLVGQQELDGLRKQQLLYQVEERSRAQHP